MFIKVLQGLRTATLFKKRLGHRCFPVNFAKFLILFNKTPLDDCFCKLKRLQSTVFSTLRQLTVYVYGYDFRLLVVRFRNDFLFFIYFVFLFFIFVLVHIISEKIEIIWTMTYLNKNISLIITKFKNGNFCISTLEHLWRKESKKGKRNGSMHS